ncbi:MAG: CoA-binding protein [Spirochaetota bacterium]|nr:CoA-binding protein [Spirochaetota bacterium]
MENVLRYFLEPESIAIVGVSRNQSRPGFLILENLKELAFEGDIYPINPEGGEILGLKIYQTIKDIPDNIDLAVLMIPPDETIDMIDKCAEKGIKNILLVSGGFSESGETGRKRQIQVANFAKEKGVRLMGPNAVGPVNSYKNLVMHFYPLGYLVKSGISMIAQSGQFCCPVLEFMNSSLNVGINKSIDVGNCCDIDEADVIEYLEDDPDTRVIAIYMESIREGRRFLDIAKRVSKKKPIVLFKTGRTEDGLRTASSHTGAIAVDDAIFDAAIKQAGIIRAKDMEEFIDFSKIFDYPIRPMGNRVGVVTYSGGIGSMVADACGDFGLKLSELSKESIEKIRPTLLPSAKISNPIDCFAVGIPLDINDAYKMPINAFMKDENVDLALSCFMVNQKVWSIDFQYILSDIKKQQTKPLIAWVIGEDSLVRESTKVLEKNGVPVFPSPERAIRAYGALCRYYLSTAKKP